MKIIVHGGAAGVPKDPKKRQAVVNEAATTGADEVTPTEAVVSAINILESSPRFNAGIGGAIQSDGVVRTDAGMMTNDREVGAACSMPGICHATNVARVVMNETPHVLVAGEHAVSLAEEFNVETSIDLKTARTRERWAEYNSPDGTVQERLDWVHSQFGGSDTVGAVAVDDDGQITAATSTGGRWCSFPGRVGDVPQIGSGFYASSAGGASATGAGEDIARVTLSREAIKQLEAGHGPQEAAEFVIGKFEELTDSTAGIIVLDSRGQVGSAYNSAEMQTSIIQP